MTATAITATGGAERLAVRQTMKRRFLAAMLADVTQAGYGFAI